MLSPSFARQPLSETGVRAAGHYPPAPRPLKDEGWVIACLAVGDVPVRPDDTEAVLDMRAQRTATALHPAKRVAMVASHALTEVSSLSL